MDADPTSAGRWLLLIVGYFVASVVYRRVSGKGVFARARPRARFVERWASARSGDGLLGRLSTGKHCLLVQVTPRELIVTPHFPISIGFMPEIYGMDRRIPVERVRRAVVLGGARVKAVEVTYTHADGVEAVLQLLLLGGDAFVASLIGARDEAPGRIP